MNSMRLWQHAQDLHMFKPDVSLTPRRVRGHRVLSLPKNYMQLIPGDTEKISILVEPRQVYQSYNKENPISGNSQPTQNRLNFFQILCFFFLLLVFCFFVLIFILWRFHGFEEGENTKQAGRWGESGKSWRKVKSTVYGKILKKSRTFYYLLQIRFFLLCYAWLS